MPGPARIDLGKAFVRVKISDSIPGVERDSRKLRKSYAWTLSADGGKRNPDDSYAVTSIRITNDDGEPVASCMIPTPVYYPLNNRLQVNMVTNAESDATEDIFWKQSMAQMELEEGKEKNIYYDVSRAPCKSFRDKIIPDDILAQRVLPDEGPVFTEEELTVFSTNVDDIDAAYLATPIAYMGDTDPEKEKGKSEESGTKKKTDEQKNKETLDTPAATADIDDTRTFVTQRDTSTSQWWVLKTAREFKDVGWPFWIEIRNNSSSVRRKISGLKNSVGHSFVCMKIRDGKESTQKNFLGNNTAYIGDVELVVEQGGQAYVYYEMKYPNDAPEPDKDSTVKNNPTKDSESKPKEKKIEPVWKKSVINMPYLQKMFSGNGESCIIGFIAVLGRLIILDGNGDYVAVSFSGDDENSLLGFNLDTNTLSICGYGCSSSICLSRMVFPERAYSVMKDMDVDATGYYIPESDDPETGLKKGALCNGRIISQPISVEMYKKNIKKSKKDKDGNSRKYPSKQYGASFSRYLETFYTPPDNPKSEKGDKGEEETKTKPTYGTVDKERIKNTEILMYTLSQSGNTVVKVRKLDNWTSGMYNMWGELHMVRYEKTIPAIKAPKKVKGKTTEAKFWFVYFETETLSTPAKDAENKDIKDQYIKCRCGFPVLYSFVCKTDRQVEKKLNPKRNITYDISNDVVAVNVERSLDSPRPTIVESKATVKVFDRDGLYGQFLAKARGIKIWMKWSTSEPTAEEEEEDSFYTDDDLVFSGIAFGRSRDQAPGEEYVTFECVDHWTVLQGMQIKNSPYYDGFRVDVAIEDMCKRAGVEFQDDTDVSQAKDGGPSYQWLGQGTTVTEPRYRFSSEKSIKDCVMELIKPFESYLFFDEEGMLHMRPVPGGFDWSLQNELWDPLPKKTYFTDIESITDYSQLITGQISISSTASSSMYNSFVLMSIDRYTGAYVIYSKSNRDSLLDPTKVGYLGFIREMRQQRPDLGGERKAMQSFLRKMIALYSRPGFEVKFTTPGHIPSYVEEGAVKNIYPGQFINLKKDAEGDAGVADIYKKRFRVLGISHSYDASNNEWNTEISAYQVESPADDTFDPSQKKK